MNTTGGDRHRRIRCAALAAATALAVGMAPALSASALSASGVSASGVSARETAAAGHEPAAAAPSATTLYVAKVNKGAVQSLVVASRATGAVVRTVASGKVVDGMNVFEDVDLAPDGTVWAVRTGRGSYESKLVTYAPGKPGVVFMPYVVAARVSPDGRRLAVTVVSPDADHNGTGTASIRVGPIGGSKFATIASSTFKVDPRTGDPTQQYMAPTAAGWIGNAFLIVRYGCCDEGSVVLMRADRPTSPQRWPAVTGDGSTQAIGLLPGGRVLVIRNRTVGDGRKVPLRTVGREAFSLSTTGRSRLVWWARPKDDSARTWARLTDAAVAATGAVPLAVSRARFPFKGAGFVTDAYL